MLGSQGCQSNSGNLGGNLGRIIPEKEQKRAERTEKGLHKSMFCKGETIIQPKVCAGSGGA